VKSRGRLIAGASLVVASVIAVTGGISHAGQRNQTVFKSNVLIGVSAPYTGETNAIRGIPGGGAPWVIGDAEARLRADGDVEVEVEGLVVDPAFPNPAVAGINPAPTWKITVSCLSTKAGAAVTTNVSTAPVNVGRDGNAEIEAKVDLPRPCFAPIIFVANGDAKGAWFAASGA
jgi:hypothetical protein